MMRLEKKQWFDTGDMNGNFSVVTQSVLYDESGKQIGLVGSQHRESFSPLTSTTRVHTLNLPLATFLYNFWEMCDLLPDECPCLEELLKEHEGEDNGK